MKPSMDWRPFQIGLQVFANGSWRFQRADVDPSHSRILGRGPAGLAALMAAALDERIQAVLIQRTLATYSSIVDSEEYEIALDWFAPGILKHFDVPDTAAAITRVRCGL